MRGPPRPKRTPDPSEASRSNRRRRSPMLPRRRVAPPGPRAARDASSRSGCPLQSRSPPRRSRDFQSRSALRRCRAIVFEDPVRDTARAGAADPAESRREARPNRSAPSEPRQASPRSSRRGTAACRSTTRRARRRRTICPRGDPPAFPWPARGSCRPRSRGSCRRRFPPRSSWATSTDSPSPPMPPPGREPWPIQSRAP